jgi:isocitrate dehydrogenase (NAD+)
VPHKVTLIPGDGIGPEVADATVRAVDATGAVIEWERVALDEHSFLAAGETIPEPVLESLGRTSVGLKGPITTPVGGGHQSLNVQLRRHLDLFANFRPVRSFPGIRTRFSDVHIDIVMFRENTEDLYAGLEHEVVKDVVTSLKVITRAASHRIAQYAFEYARRERRQKITAVHKANIMKLSDGLFLRCCREVAAEFPDIQYKELIVDNTAMQMVIRPEMFDVLLMPNLYGDIVSDLAAGLIGGLGIVPSANLGERCAVFEAVHGSAPDIAGRGLANPTALMQSAALMLNHLGESEAARRLQRSIEWVYAAGRELTPDVGGTGSTEGFTSAVVERIRQSG